MKSWSLLVLASLLSQLLALQTADAGACRYGNCCSNSSSCCAGSYGYGCSYGYGNGGYGYGGYGYGGYGTSGYCTGAYSNCSGAAPAYGPHSAVDRPTYNFMRKAAADGRAEIMLARLASARASAPEIRDYARQLLSDHHRANSVLASLARRKRVSLAGGIPVSEVRFYNGLRRSRNWDFDDAYITRMISNHRQAIDEFSYQAAYCADYDLRSFAADTVPMLRNHLAAAQSLAAYFGF